jgi:hypothetical protein
VSRPSLLPERPLLRWLQIKLTLERLSYLFLLSPAFDCFEWRSFFLEKRVVELAYIRRGTLVMLARILALWGIELN